MEIVQADSNAMLIIESNDEAQGYMEWKPTNNTIAYYKFENNLNDSSWNNRNLSMATWSFSYWTLSSWIKYVQTNKSAQTNSISIPYNKWVAFTLNFRLSFDSVYNTYWTSIIEIHSWWSDWIIRPVHSWNSSASTRIFLLNNNSLTYTPSPVWSWNMYTFVCDWNWIKFYVNSNLIWTGSLPMPNTNNPYFKINWVWNNTSTTYTSQDKISEFILEKAKWNQSDIQKHYNRTKSLYWY